MGSNPRKKLSLLGIAHPVEGSLFQVQGVYRRTTLTRGRILEESRVWLWYSFCRTCIKIVNLIFVLVKSNVITLELCYIVDMYLVSIDVQAHVAIFTHFNCITTRCGRC